MADLPIAALRQLEFAVAALDGGERWQATCLAWLMPSLLLRSPPRTRKPGEGKEGGNFSLVNMVRTRCQLAEQGCWDDLICSGII